MKIKLKLNLKKKWKSGQVQRSVSLSQLEDEAQ